MNALMETAVWRGKGKGADVSNVKEQKMEIEWMKSLKRELGGMKMTVVANGD